MADFLSRLAERAMGTAPLARPVIAPLFATVPELGADTEAFEDGRSDVAGVGLSTAPDSGATSAPMRLGPLVPEPVGRVPEARRARIVEARSPAQPDARIPGFVERERTEETRHRTVDPGPMRTTAAVRSLMPARPVPPDREPARPRPLVASLPSEAERSSPIVRVYIGRVEVRAVAPPPAAARPAAARADDHLSLGEYLRGEKRRR